MLNRLGPIQRTIIYALLLTGAIVFSMPFVWMACTSVKVDRELFAGGLRILPLPPRPREQSPYIDESYLDTLAPPRRPMPPGLQPLLAEFVQRRLTAMPAGVPRQLAVEQIVRGLYTRLTRILPDDVWNGSPAEIVRAADERVPAPMLRQIADSVYRRLCFGQMRVRSTDLVEDVLGDGLPFSKRLQNRTPQTARLVDDVDKDLRFARVEYDFTKGDRIVLDGEYELSFPVTKFQRIQLYMRPDDTWHDLRLTLEMGGARWTMLTWQLPGPDDHSTKIKTWILLHKTDEGPQYVSDPHRIRVTLEVRQADALRAWWNKLRLNYERVLDFIPFWRYVRTSLFLVIVNVVLTIFACSLVAYAFARLQWPGRGFCFVLMLATMMIPPQVTMIPNFLIWKNLGAYNTLTPLWLGAAFGNAFFIFLLRQFLKGIPRDLEDAARIDGCGFLRIYWHIMLPLIRPSLAAIGIFTFMGTWNNFMGPLIYIADQRIYPLAFGLYAFAVQVGNNPALTMAASLLMTVPVIIIFFFAQKYFIQGVTLTGIKG